MMEETIDTIDDRADVEWKFARSRLYMEYIRDGKDLLLFSLSYRKSFLVDLGSTLPVPMNICPTPKSFIYLIKRLKKMIISDPSSKKDANAGVKRQDDGLDGLNIRPRNISSNSSAQHDKSKIKQIFERPRNNNAIHEKLTYKIVIERIVKRFLLYYKNKHTRMNDTKEGLEFKEFKNDISSLRFELLNEIDGFDELRLVLIQQMQKLNEDLQTYFDVEQIKVYLSNQKD